MKLKPFRILLYILCASIVISIAAYYLSVSQPNNTTKSVDVKTTEAFSETFLLDALISDKREQVFRFPQSVSVGFGHSRASNLQVAEIYQEGFEYRASLIDGVWANFFMDFFKKLKTSLGLHRSSGVYDVFYAPLGEELKSFLPQMKDDIGFDISFVSAQDEMSTDENNNVKIRIIADRSFTGWVDGKPVFRGHGRGAFTAIFIHDDPRLRDDAISFKISSPHLRGWAFFDEKSNLTWAVCQMWQYMEPPDRQAAMRECVVRALGIVGELRDPAYFHSASLSNNLKKALSFLYCQHVKSGMSREDVLEILRQKECL
ncbi:MAG TPA: hypothetical protein VHP34_06560 [Alphaproteobacteria bacterium]|nr:hypothetical protein [Alphaproteobacteria bacterium]